MKLIRNFGLLLTITCLLLICQVQANNCTDINCLSCSNSTGCLECIMGYTPYDGSCIECNVQNCGTCNATNQCFECDANYTLLNNKCILCQINACSLCLTPNVCQQCDNTNKSGDNLLYPNIDHDACVLCAVKGCVKCRFDNSCGVCQAGYTIYPPVLSANYSQTTQSCYLCQVDNCLTCSAKDVCAICAQGYQVSSTGSCFICSAPCATCNANQTCATCQTPYYIQTPTSAGLCLFASVPNCQTYSTSNTSQCLACFSPYTLNSTSNTCQLVCTSPCLTCNATSCLSCPNGYFLQGGSCVTCAAGCQTCSSGSSCTSCVNGFYLKNGQCVKCSSYCSSCTSASCDVPRQTNIIVIVIFRLLNGQKKPAKCNQNCLSCSSTNPSICNKCRDGFYVNTNGKCKKCTGNCRECSSSQPSSCITCYTNDFLVGNQCLKCDSNCLTCVSSTQLDVCTRCPDNAYLSSGICIQQGCSDNCISCSNSTTCTSCLSGHTLFQDNKTNQVTCQQCITNCRICAKNQPGDCLECGDGFYLDGDTCTECPQNCVQCLNSQRCTTCQGSYYLTSSQTCAENCKQPCATCSSTNPYKCQTCLAGYQLVGTECQGVISCAGGCEICPSGYALSEGSCLQCTQVNCQVCQADSLSICQGCVEGYYLVESSGTCSVCSNNCQTCISSTVCTACLSGYVAQTFTQGGFSCIACQSPCLTCQSKPEQCLTCVDGYSIRGWKCIKNFRFTFTITLLTTFNIFYNNYGRFRSALTTGRGNKLRRGLSIFKIKQGSVIVDGSVDAEASAGTNEATKEYNSLALALAENGQIEGMRIAGSSVSVTGGSVTSEQSSNLGLILGITIPLGILLILGIVIFIYSKRKSADLYKDDGSDSYQKKSSSAVSQQQFKNDDSII